MKNLYIANIEVHGVLLFSKIQESLKEAILSPGPLIRSSIYIHNYPLIYGLMNYSSEEIYGITGKPSYRVVDEALNTGIYVYPGEPIHVNYVRIFLSPTPETLIIPEKPKPKIVHPQQVHYYAIGPGSIFKTVIITPPGYYVPRYIRIGKKRWGLLRIRLVKPEEIIDITEKYTGFSTIPVNIGDMRRLGVEIIDTNTVLVTRNNPYIGDRSIIGYVRAKPMIRITYKTGNRLRREYIPVPPSILREII